MTFHAPLGLVLVGLASASLALSPVAHAADSDFLASWKAGQAREQDGGYLVPDVKKSYDLLAPSSAGISLGDKPPVGDDTKSLVFDGLQGTVFRTVSPFPVSTGTLAFSVAVKPAAQQTDPIGGTVLRYGTQWELRYEQDKQAMVFIVWHEDRTSYTTVRVPAAPDQWHLVEGTLEQDVAVLQVGSDTKQTPLKGPMAVEAKPAALLVGASSPSPEGRPQSRPFTGAIAAIKATAQ